MSRTRCPGYSRHWFGLWGFVGVRAPVCERCGAPNPRKLTPDELAEYEGLMRQRSQARPCPHPSDCTANGCAGKCDEAITSRMRPGDGNSQAKATE